MSNNNDLVANVGDKMKILIDGDACPVKNEIFEIAFKYDVEVIYFCSLSHYSESNIFPRKVLVDNESQAVDMEIMRNLDKGDIVITQDYGLASLSLDKNAYVLSFNGKNFTKDNINIYLYQRYLSAQQRQKRIKTLKQKKRHRKENLKFKEALEKLIGHLKNNPQVKKNC
ncbi:YaiI/YqxD family protein [Garciella nitratireducens]|uniref:YaiI/YqxD family protein n=1 Tax=Garciella nitratireducens TaxID=218205 RepID=UPI000DE91885|nr:YaiI/YqxD family protein [Garciella nitratireducens]RBP45512.1 hypothetical protein DFR81_10245 [Garciella nitratireducens]